MNISGMIEYLLCLFHWDRETTNGGIVCNSFKTQHCLSLGQRGTTWENKGRFRGIMRVFPAYLPRRGVSLGQLISRRPPPAL